MNEEEKRLKRRKEYIEILHALAVIFFVIFGILAAAYVGLYLMFIKSIIDCAMAFDAGTLNGGLIIWSAVKMIFAGSVGYLILVFNLMIARRIVKM